MCGGEVDAAVPRPQEWPDLGAGLGLCPKIDTKGHTLCDFIDEVLEQAKLLSTVRNQICGCCVRCGDTVGWGGMFCGQG